MVIQTLSLDSLSEMSESEIIAALRAFGDLPINGEVEAANESVRAFEQQYEMTTAEMMRKVGDGTMRETHDIVKWTMLADTIVIRSENLDC